MKKRQATLTLVPHLDPLRIMRSNHFTIVSTNGGCAPVLYSQRVEESTGRTYCGKSPPQWLRDVCESRLFKSHDEFEAAVREGFDKSEAQHPLVLT